MNYKIIIKAENIPSETIEEMEFELNEIFQACKKNPHQLQVLEIQEIL